MIEKNIYIKLIIILVIFFTFMFLIIGIPNIKEQKYESTIIVGNGTVWNYHDKKWVNITSNGSIQNLNWKKYKVFINNIKLGDYYLWKDDKWYAFDDKKNAINLDGYLLAYLANYDLKVFNFSEDAIINRIYVDEVLRQNGLSVDSKFTSSSKISFDFDNDGFIEDFYLISNVFPEDFNPDNIFSIVFMVKNDEIYPIYTDVNSNQGLNGCMPRLRSFLDVNADNTSELILSCARYSMGGVVDMLYEFKNGEFKILISNQ